jgi:DNA-binding CsgD family transcriptional regulator
MRSHTERRSAKSKITAEFLRVIACSVLLVRFAKQSIRKYTDVKIAQEGISIFLDKNFINLVIVGPL